MIEKLIEFEKSLRGARVAYRPELVRELRVKLFPILDKLFDSYPDATVDERIDLQSAFDSRPELQGALVAYMQDVLNRFQKVSAKNRGIEKETLLKRAIIAGWALEQRSINEQQEAAQERLAMVIRQEKFNTKEFSKDLRLTPLQFAQRARRLQQRGVAGMAAQSLARAMELNPDFRHNEKVAELAADITGMTGRQAMDTLKDPFHRQMFVQQFDGILPKDSKQRRGMAVRQLNWFSEHDMDQTEFVIAAGTVLFLGSALFFLLNRMIDLAPVAQIDRSLLLLDGGAAAFGLVFGFLQFIVGSTTIWVRYMENKIKIHSPWFNMTATLVTMDGAAAFVTGITLAFGGLMLLFASVADIKIVTGIAMHHILLFYLTGGTLWLTAYMAGWIIEVYRD